MNKRKKVAWAKHRKAAKKELIQRAVEQANGNLTEAARSLGVNPNYLHRLINNLDLRSVLKK